MTTQAGRLDDPGVEAQVATWYHPGGGLLARGWFTGSPVRGEKWWARGRTGDGGEEDVAAEATEVRRTETSVMKGFLVRRGDGPKTPDGVGGEGAVDRGAIHSQ